MNCKKCLALSLVIVAGFALIPSVAIAQQSKDSKPAPAQAGAAPMQLPPGWTAEDMQACMAAMTPGDMHKHLAEGVGVWQGKNTLWMYPGAEPVKTDSTATITPMLGGRFIKCEMAGEMPGMGPYSGFAIYGFDNVSQQFVSTWIDNCGTGMATGTGTLSSDGKTLTWNYTYNCPMQKKACALREIATITGPNSRTLEIIGTDPKSGKECKMMELLLTRKPGTEGTAAAPAGAR